MYVLLDGDVPSDAADTQQSGLAVAQERIRGLEEQVAVLQGQLDLEQRRNAGLVDELTASQERRRPQWRF